MKDKSKETKGQLEIVEDIADPFYDEDNPRPYENLVFNISKAINQAIAQERVRVLHEVNAVKTAAEESTVEQWEVIKEGIRKEERERIMERIELYFLERAIGDKHLDIRDDVLRIITNNHE